MVLCFVLFLDTLVSQESGANSRDASIWASESSENGPNKRGTGGALYLVSCETVNTATTGGALVFLCLGSLSAVRPISEN